MDGTREEHIRAARSAVEAHPEDLPARLRLAAALLESGDPGAALEQFALALARDPANLEALKGAADAASAAGDPARAEGYRRVLNALRLVTDSPVHPPALPAGPDPGGDDSRLSADPAGGHAQGIGGAEGGEAGVGFLRRPRQRMIYRGGPTDEEWRVEESTVTLAQVGGMEAVKRRLTTAFLAPLRNPDLKRMYGKSLRGGLLLYGPPGCGKTFIAQATAGELGARFMTVRLSQELDTWLGDGERKLREIFETSRRSAPCVLFFSELDALGPKHGPLKHHGRAVVNQLLAELDQFLSETQEGLFVLGATNHPWDVDVALLRPGRFDRRLLVLPPDEPAREAILKYHLRDRPIDGLDVGWIAARTADYSGADLAHLCEAAAEIALEASAASAAVRPITLVDFEHALKDVRPTTRPWFETARNYALFANEGGTYDELLAYMRTRSMV